ncbi:MAG: N-acetylglucosamine transport system substrate-binding protein [Chloroflexota bacterium]|jgi:N-acetylglucosamine transport system substrate-binding protein|nr:N-acetylglucosamine transport system substrate-binding protein [Chloroflexota bacterium]
MGEHDGQVRVVSRRRFLGRSAAFLGSTAAFGILQACAGRATPSSSAPIASGGPGLSPGASGEATNPLGVPAGEPLEVVIFKGGYGDDYAINAEKIFNRVHPDTKITHLGIQRLREQLQPRFVGGNPPDVIDNSGGGNLDTAALVAEGQLADLADLMDAPALDTPGETFGDTLLAGSQSGGVFDGKQHVLKYASFVFGIWYSDSLFKSKGWQYPKTWDEMLTLSDEIKKAGISPWTYEGKNPYYFTQIFNQMIWKHGGMQTYVNLDNLEPNAWKQPEVVNVAEALYQLADRGFFLPGTEGLTNTESQAEWLQGKAALLPVGSWIENEMKGLIPDGFDMVVQPTPSLDASDKVPAQGIQSGAGEDFIVPAQGKNVQAGKEFLRVLFSRESAKFFAENTKSTTVVLNSTEGLKLGTAFDSVITAVSTAGPNLLDPLAGYVVWYNKLVTEVNNQMASLLTKRIQPAEFLGNIQKVADQIAQDPSIKKYKRSA